MKKTLENIIGKLELDYAYRVNLAAANDGISLAELKRKAGAEMEERYVKARKRNRGFDTPGFQKMFLDELEEGRAVIFERLDRKYFEQKRRMDVSAIELPYIRQRLEETLGARGIVFELSRNSRGNILAIQIVKELFVEGPISTSNIEKVISLAKYFIKRPDCLRREMPEYRIVHKYSYSHPGRRR